MRCIGISKYDVTAVLRIFNLCIGLPSDIAQILLWWKRPTMWTLICEGYRRVFGGFGDLIRPDSISWDW